MKKGGFFGANASIWLSLLMAVTVLCAVRITNVNRASWLEKYAANVVRYAEGEEVALPSEMYYFSGCEELAGYYMQVEKTELIPTEILLAEYDMTLDDLESISTFGADADFSDYAYTYIVTAQFWNQDYASNADYYIQLDNFLLVGLDYSLTPSTDAVMAIPDFNPILEGNSSFGISSDRILTIKIAYLIDTESETSISIDYLTQSNPKLLVGYYPEEVYLELPTAILQKQS